MDSHEITCGLFLPPELAFQPGQPIAMAGDCFAFGKPSTDLDHIADNTLAEGADDGGVLGQGDVVGGAGPSDRLHSLRCLDIRQVVPVFQREFLAFAVRLHRVGAFSMQLTRPYALETSFHVRSLRSSRRVRVASRMTAIDPSQT